jgi:hypothetical protein
VKDGAAPTAPLTMPKSGNVKVTQTPAIPPGQGNPRPQPNYGGPKSSQRGAK